MPAEPVGQVLQQVDGWRRAALEVGLVLLQDDQRLVGRDRVDPAPEDARLEALDIDLDEAERTEIDVQGIEAFDPDLDMDRCSSTAGGDGGIAVDRPATRPVCGKRVVSYALWTTPLAASTDQGARATMRQLPPKRIGFRASRFRTSGSNMALMPRATKSPGAT